MVESTALEMRRGGNSIVGSNPTLSARFLMKLEAYKILFFDEHMYFHLVSSVNLRSHTLGTGPAVLVKGSHISGCIS